MAGWRLLLAILILAGLVQASPAAPQAEVTPPLVPRPSATSFVIARDGHFYLDDQRVRFWGFNLQAGVFPSYDEIRALVDRLSRLGINAVRLWPTQDTFYAGLSLVERRFVTSTQGDGSLLDRYDFLVAELKRKGIFIQNPGLHYVDVEAIRYWPDPQTRAIIGPAASASDIRRLHAIAPYLSSAWEAMLATHIRNYLSHVNPYTRRSYADEPVFSGWELANESQFVQCALRHDCVAGLPPLLHDELSRLWRTWWRDQGGDPQQGLPVYNGNWDRVAHPLHAAYRRFVYDRFVLVSHRLERIARAMAPPGQGIAVQPLTYSTDGGDPLLVARAAYSTGDFSAIGAYQTPLDPNRSSPYFPFRLNFVRPIFYNFNYGAVAAKPTIVYENSFFRPYPWRVEWPWALLELAVKQDWDALFLYTYGQPRVIYTTASGKTPRYGDKPLPIPSDPKDSAPHGVYFGLHHGGDEVTVAAWSAAGLAFLGGELANNAQARNYTFTTKEIFGPAPGYCTPPGCGVGGRQLIAEMNTASLTSPIRLRLSRDATSAATSEANGAVANRKAIQSFLALQSDLPTLKIDSPRNKAVVGVLDGEIRFADGFAIRFPRRQFGFVSLASADGTALRDSRDIRVYAAGQSANSGFEFDGERVDFSRATGTVRGVVQPGRAPIVFERPSFDLALPHQARFQRFDFNLDGYRESTASEWPVGADEPFFTGRIVP